MTALPYTLPTLLPGGSAVYDVTADATGGGDGTLRALTSHCEAGKALLIAQYRDKPRIAALLCAYLDRVQSVDDATARLYEHGLSLETAQGVHLDLIGKIVREARDGRDDDSYRRGLRVRVLVNRSQGRIRDLIAVAALYEGAGVTVRIREYQPARLVVYMGGIVSTDPDGLHKRLRQAKAAGVALQTVTHPAPPDGSRIFALGNGAASADTTNTTTGLGWTGDTRGGYLGHVLA